MKKPRILLPSDVAPTIPPLELTASTILGEYADGKTAMLAELAQAGKPLVLLFSSRSCSQCKSVKDELEPFLGEFPFPVHAIIEGAASQQDSNGQTLFDPKGTLRRSLAIIGVPAMVVIDPDTMKVAQPVCDGPEAIRRNIMRLLLNASQPLKMNQKLVREQK